MQVENLRGAELYAKMVVGPQIIFPRGRGKNLKLFSWPDFGPRGVHSMSADTPSGVCSLCTRCGRQSKNHQELVLASDTNCALGACIGVYVLSFRASTEVKDRSHQDAMFPESTNWRDLMKPIRNDVTA